MAKTRLPQLAQRQAWANGFTTSIGLTGDIGYLSIDDRNFYPEEDSRARRRELGYNTMMIPCMTRQQLKELHTAIGEVLKNSR